MIIKCKMCGGDIQFNPGDTNGQCDHCGCTTTFPKLPDEQRANLFNRANHFRRQCEFDKAMAAYEHILEEDDTDAEAHWGIVLSKFGIEYVEDPVTHERIPTCHRAQVISILSDEDYQNALKYAPDTYSREIYEKEAKRIAEIQKGILAISSQEKPYDVFICYKETDDSGSRTKDSTLAQEIYYQLTNEGYKVFFSRITLEDKLGQEYEPYIFAALNSAKVMLVIGTKPEFFNAVWVKNEWNRYLALMKNDRKRVLIPCYRDMDPYDLPEELSSLQSQDMGKIGFMQDIIHGVKKVLGSDKQTAPNVTVQAAGPGVASLHKRAVLFLEDKDWDSATEYFDRILDIDPEYAPAYIGKVQVKNKVRREADLSRCREPISTDPDFQKAVRFADEKQKAIYNGYNRAILDRLELERKEAVYREAVALENRAAVEADFLAAAKKYDSAGNIRDAKDRAANCRAKASSARAEAEKAAAVYKEQMERERKEQARQEEERRLAEEKRRAEEAERQRKEKELRKEYWKRATKVGALVAAIVLLVTGGYYLFENVIQPRVKYNRAQSLLNDGKYDEAYSAFEAMGDFSDSQSKLLEINYRKAEDHLAAKDYANAREYFTLAGTYSDANQQIQNIDNYIAAQTDYENGNLISAGEKYKNLGNFSDAEAKFERIAPMLYAQAKTAIESKNYKDVFDLLSVLGDYSDCTALMAGIDEDYNLALQHLNDGEKYQAEQELQALSGWREATDKLSALRLEIADDAYTNGDYAEALSYYEKLQVTDETKVKIDAAQRGKYYLEALAALESGDLETANTKFIAAGNHADASDQARKLVQYKQANSLVSEGKYKEARKVFIALGNYLDASQKTTSCNEAIYTAAKTALEGGNIAEAYDSFTLISGYSDSSEIVAKIDGDYQKALDHIEKRELLEAEAILLNMRGWSDVDSLLVGLWEEIADNAVVEKKYDQAITYYKKISDRSEGLEAKLRKAKLGKNYTEGIAFLNAGELDSALEKFTAAGEFEDATAQLARLMAYQQAELYLSEEKYKEARTIYIRLGDYLQSTERLEACNAAIYGEATVLKTNGDYAKANELFVLISGYSDSAEIASQFKADYQAATDLLNKGSFDDAYAAFEALKNYSDSPEKAKESMYLKAESLKEVGSIDDAVAIYSGLGDYKDSAEKINICLYSKAETQITDGKTDEAITTFESISNYSDSSERANLLRYDKAKALRSNGELQAARQEYEVLGDYSDSADLLVQVLTEIADKAMDEKDYVTALSAYQSLDQTDYIKEREYMLAQLCYDEGHFAEAVFAYESLGQYELSLSKLPIARYAWADQLFNDGEYEKAAEQFALLGDMTDSAARADESIYQLASEKLAAKSYDGAKDLFISIANYKNAGTLAKGCDYRKASDLFAEGKIKDAEILFKSLGEYSDSKTKAEECIYIQAEALFSAKKYADAKPLYDTITYSDSQTKSKQCVYNQAEALFAAKKYNDASKMYDSIDYLDSKDKAKQSTYQEAETYYSGNQFAEAEAIFLSLSDYADSADRSKDCHLQQGIVLMDAEDYRGALEFFETVEYKNSADLAAKCHYELGRISHLTGKTDEAVAEYAYAVSLPEVRSALLSASKDYSVINEPEKAIQTLWVIRDQEDAQNELIKIAETAKQNGKNDLALLSYSIFEEPPEFDFTDLYQNTSYDSIKTLAGKCSLLADDIEFREYTMYHFAAMARDYGLFDVSVQAYSDLGEYSDSAQQIKKIEAYVAAEADYQNNALLLARAKYLALGDFLDSLTKFETVSGTLYTQAKTAIDSKDYEQAFNLLTALGGYSDCPTLIANIDSEYEAALALWNNGEKLQAEQDLQSFVGWRDANEKLVALRLEIADDAVKNEDYDTALAYYGKVPNTKEIESKAALAKAKKGKAYQEAIKALEAGEFETAYTNFVVAGEYKDAPQQAAQVQKYQQANKLLSAGKYEEARVIYIELEDYLQSSSCLTACNSALYQEATEFYRGGNLTEAYRIYTLISGYSDSKEIVDSMDSDYQAALGHIEKGELLEAEAILANLVGWSDADVKLEMLRKSIADNAFETRDYVTAISYYDLLDNRTFEIEEKRAATLERIYFEARDALGKGELDVAHSKFTAAGNYLDATEQARNIDAYKQANSLLAEGKYQEARTAYIELGTFLDSATKLNTCNDVLYQEATSLMKQGDFAKAYELFVLISGYSDSADIAKKIRDDYKAAENLLENGNYDEAKAAFLAMHNYSDSPAKAKESLYQKAESLKSAGSYDDAIAVYSDLGKYKDSPDKINVCHYSKAESLLAGKDIDGAILLFESISDFRDSSARAQALRYEKAQTLHDNGDLQAARAEYEILGEYSNASELLTKVRIEIADNFMANEDYASALAGYQGLEQTAEIQAREYKLASVCYEKGHYEEATSAYETLGQYQLSLSKLPIARYAWADQLFNNGEYEKAAEQFALLGDMTDCAVRANESIYQLASEKLTAKSYDDAKGLFNSIVNYKDAGTLAKECDYRKATDLLAEGKNNGAEVLFKSLGDYSDSRTKAEVCIYNQAEILFTAKKYDEAKLLYDTIFYSDSLTKSKQCVYNQAEALFAAGKYAEAKPLYDSIDYSDSQTKSKQCVYNQAEALFAAKKYNEASKMYDSIVYLDSKDKAKLSTYQEAETYYSSKQYAEAEALFLSLKDYSDSANRAKDCHLQQGIVLMDAEDYRGALEFLETIEYENSAVLAAKCHYELGRISHLTGKTDEAVAEYAYAVLLPEASNALLSAAKDYSVINEPEKAIQTLWLIRNQENAQNELIKIANTANQNGKNDLALLSYSVFEEHPEIDFTDLYQNTSYDNIKLLADNCSLLAESFEFKEYTMYHFACMAQDYCLYDVSARAYSDLGEYSDSTTKVLETKYDQGKAKRTAADWDGAVKAFMEAGTYSDAATQISETRYQEASAKEKDGDQQGAYDIFIGLGEYRDSFARANKPYYDLGITKKEAGEWDAAVAAFEHAGRYNDAPTQILATRYAEGEAKMAASDWDGAIEAFSAAQKYEDAVTKVFDCKYSKATALKDNKNYQEALDLFFEITEYKDAKEQMKACFYGIGKDLEHQDNLESALDSYQKAIDYRDASERAGTVQNEINYRKATDLYNSGEYVKAQEIYQKIPGYRDSEKKAQDCKGKREARLKPFKTVGSIVKFGIYPQFSSGKDDTPIEWIVLETKGNSSLLLSRYGLDARPFHNTSDDFRSKEHIYWGNCDLRTWLNDSFLTNAFTSAESEAILTTNVDNGRSQGFSEWVIVDGKNTQDKVFLLSYSEANKYLNVSRDLDASLGSQNNPQASIKLTEYAEEQGNYCYFWWLRTVSGDYTYTQTTCVAKEGYLDRNLAHIIGIIRPALWINLASDIF